MDVRHRRSKMLRSLSVKKRRKFYEDNLQRHATVLFEDDVEDGMMHGFTENYIRVAAKYDPMHVNSLKKVVLTNVNGQGYVEVREPWDHVLI